MGLREERRRYSIELRVREVFDALETYADVGRRVKLTREAVRLQAEAGLLPTVETPVGRLVVRPGGDHREVRRQAAKAFRTVETYEAHAIRTGRTKEAVRQQAKKGKLPTVLTRFGRLVVR